MCSFALPASAADGTEPIDTSSMKITAHVFESSEEIDITDSLIISSSGASAFPDCLKIVYPLPENGVDRVGISLLLNENFSINTEHEYNLSFDYGFSHGLPTLLQVALVYYDSSGSLVDEQIIITEEQFYGDKKYSVDVDFKPVLPEEITGGYKCNFEIRFVQTGRNENSFMQRFFVSSEIDLMDKDDDSGWFQKIINKIEETISNIKQIPEKINQKLTELKESITNAFIELKENLIEGLKGLFVPSDGFFEEKKAELELFLEDHFGILWTAPNIMISTIEQLLTMSPEEPSITMPAIQFTWEDELITLTEPMTVHFNDYIGEGTPLETFYNFYRVFVTIILIFLFINYCLKKYHYIFGKDGEAVEH